jgi:hypothetical protein
MVAVATMQIRKVTRVMSPLLSRFGLIGHDSYGPITLGPLSHKNKSQTLSQSHQEISGFVYRLSLTCKRQDLVPIFPSIGKGAHSLTPWQMVEKSFPITHAHSTHPPQPCQAYSTSPFAQTELLSHLTSSSIRASPPIRQMQQPDRLLLRFFAPSIVPLCGLHTGVASEILHHNSVTYS